MKVKGFFEFFCSVDHRITNGEYATTFLDFAKNRLKTHTILLSKLINS
jgi:hypothetical protein